MADSFSQFLSIENFRQAWARVAANNGCAGVDGETIAQFGHDAERKLSQLIHHLVNGSYRPLPLRQLFIPKRGGGWRELQVPTVRDRVVQQALLNVLHPVFEPQFEVCSFAYRPGRSHRMAVDQVSAWQKRGFRWVLDGDIIQYFNNVGHERLLAEVAERLPGLKNRKGKREERSRALALSSSFTDLVLHLVEQWISVGVLTREGLVLPERGIAQGSVVSPILANIYLDDFDEALLATDLKLVRYADDFVILGRKQRHITEARQQVAELMDGMGLRLHPDKTQITSFEKGFRFLGHAFVGDLVVPVKRAAVKAEGRRQRAERGSSNLRLVHADGPGQANQMQQAMVTALKASQQPVPPPLFVVLGYRVRPEQRVEIKSTEAI
jgi:CRISPR-associated protein Cas1